MLREIIFLFTFTLSASQSCFHDSDCQSLNSCSNNQCVHKDLMPLASTEILGTFLLFLVSLISSAAGVGGAVVTTSFSLLLFHFEPHAVVALSQAFVFAVTITTVVLKFRGRHPVADRPLIYYDLLMEFISPLLLGVNIGVLFNPSFPGWLLLALLTVVLVYVTFEIFIQGRKFYIKESISRKTSGEEEKLAKQDLSNTPNTGAIGAQMKEENKEDHVQTLRDINRDAEAEYLEDENVDEIKGNEKNEDCEENTSERKNKIVEDRDHVINDESKDQSEIEDAKLQRQVTAILDSEKSSISYVSVAFFSFFISFSIIMELLRGSTLTPSISNIHPCSPSYYAVLIVYILVMLALSLITSIFLIRKTKICQKAKYKFDEGDILWSPGKCLTVFLTALITGVLVGLIGLGGGLIIGPILLRLKVRPEVMTVTSSVIICVSGFVAVFQYLIFGVLDWKYAFWYWMTAIIGSLTGNLGLRKFVIKIGRSSFLVFFLSVISFVALVIIPTVGIIDAINQNRNGNFQLGFTGLC